MHIVCRGAEKIVQRSRRDRRVYTEANSGKSAEIVQTLSAQLQVPPEKLINRQADSSKVWLPS